MDSKERILNILLGLSLIYWSFAGFYAAYSADAITRLSILISLLNLTVGLLIIFRMPLIKAAAPKALLISLPAFIAGGLLFKLAQPLLYWTFTAELIFVCGSLIAITSFLFLGKSFAILPGMRNVVSKGMYRLVRHPAYLGESLMVIACLISAETYWSILVFAFFIPGIILRIRAEENLLFLSPYYKQYANHVTWRLIPFVW
ncbi:MAG: protein-S-isoprenylcysteine O-methyltransferase Ste14 [Crocinitomix sp.]|jgi:protein-S-isoprenylcysteine O-methyltransferase Ste14